MTKSELVAALKKHLVCELSCYDKHIFCKLVWVDKAKDKIDGEERSRQLLNSFTSGDLPGRDIICVADCDLD